MYGMNKEVEKIIQEAVNETLATLIHEEHERGEWWIDESGTVTFADNTIGDSGHESIVISYLSNEILSHFGIEEDEVGFLNEWENELKAMLVADDNFTPEDEIMWEHKGPTEVILKKLIEDGAYKDPEQAEDAVYIAWGSSSRDARDYAMKYLRWKLMKSHGADIEVQTWTLKPEDLDIVVRGIWDIIEDTESTDDSDNEIGADGYPGPRINLTIQSKGQRFHDIPLAVLEKRLPSSLLNYRSGVNLKEGYDFHHLHKKYRLYEGNNKIVALFEDGSRLMFEVHFHNNHGPDKKKYRHRAFTTWKSLATEIYNDVTINEVGNPIQLSWKESFKKALKHPKLQEYIRQPHHQKVFDNK
jgi:hypothetical protein